MHLWKATQNIKNGLNEISNLLNYKQALQRNEI